VAGELTMFSGPRDGGACRPGAGCTFAEWAEESPDDEVAGLGPNGYAPRWAYGEYLEHVLSAVSSELHRYAEVVTVVDRVVAVRDRADHYDVQTAEGGAYDADAVVLATGHPVNGLAPEHARFAAVAKAHPGLLFLPGGSVADMPLDDIPAGADVGVIGMGLSFYDLVLSLTVGRGGSFEHDGDQMVYLPSGKEPRIVAGSRSGVPIRTRGQNQKAAGGRSHPHFLTQATVAARRNEALARNGHPALDLWQDFLPLLWMEVNHTYLTALARRRDESAGRRLSEELLSRPAIEWPAIAARHGVTANPIDIEVLARPFSGRHFAGPARYRAALREVLGADLEEARSGNVDGPLKAALDMIRDCREVIRSTVEFGGLTPESHRHFQNRVAADLSLLSTGPAVERTEQFLALVDSGHVDVAGPGTVFGVEPSGSSFFVESPQVADSRRSVSVLVDSRIPLPCLNTNQDPLIRQLVRDGLVEEYVNRRFTDAHHTGGLRISPAENRVVSPGGQLHRGLYAVGIPTENVRWFTQIGNLRPDGLSQFEREAEAIALSIVRKVTQTAGEH
jgi:methylaspartate mutase epsilon subunit